MSWYFESISSNRSKKHWAYNTKDQMYVWAVKRYVRSFGMHPSIMLFISCWYFRISFEHRCSYSIPGLETMQHISLTRKAHWPMPGQRDVRSIINFHMDDVRDPQSPTASAWGRSFLYDLRTIQPLSYHCEASLWYVNNTLLSRNTKGTVKLGSRLILPPSGGSGPTTKESQRL